MVRLISYSRETQLKKELWVLSDDNDIHKYLAKIICNLMRIPWSLEASEDAQSRIDISASHLLSNQSESFGIKRNICYLRFCVSWCHDVHTIDYVEMFSQLIIPSIHHNTILMRYFLIDIWYFLLTHYH